MHLAADRAAMRARGAVLRQQAGLGHGLVEIFRDRQRVPDLDAVMGQARHQERGRQQQQFGAGRGIVAGDRLLLEIEPGHLAQQPAAQRPGAVVLAGDGEGQPWPWGAIIPVRHGPASGSLDESSARSIPSRAAKTHGRRACPQARPALNIISHCNIKCTSFRLRSAGAAGDWMLYQAYQAHSDIMGPVRAFAGMAARTMGERLNGSARPSALGNLTAAYELIARAGLTHARPPYGIDSVMVGNREVAVTEEAAEVTPFGTLLHFKKDIDQAQPRVLLVAPLSGHFATLLRATVRTMLAEHDVYITDWHNARDVSTDRRPLRLRRICRPPDPLPGDDRAGRACGRGVPALRRRAGGGGGDGAGRQSGRAALDDADGRPDRHPRQSDQGQRARQGQADRMVREEPDRARAAPLRRRRAQGLSGLRAARRLHEHEHRAPS